MCFSLIKRFVTGTFRLLLMEYEWECTYVKGTRETGDGLKERQISMQFLKTHVKKDRQKLKTRQQLEKVEKKGSE